MNYEKLLRPHPIKPDDHKMTVAEFTEAVQTGMFIDWDGSGFYATDTHYFWNLPAIPSLFRAGLIWDGFTHVVWFNK